MTWAEGRGGEGLPVGTQAPAALAGTVMTGRLPEHSSSSSMRAVQMIPGLAKGNGTGSSRAARAAILGSEQLAGLGEEKRMGEAALMALVTLGLGLAVQLHQQQQPEVMVVVGSRSLALAGVLKEPWWWERRVAGVRLGPGVQAPMNALLLLLLELLQAVL